MHRPYLRADPTAYPESTEICLRAAQFILSAYRVGAGARASIMWLWWTMSYRVSATSGPPTDVQAFHAGTVCAFIAIREPHTERSQRCMVSQVRKTWVVRLTNQDDLRGAIAILEDRSATWHTSHPVQGDLCNGLVKLLNLAT